MYNKILGDVWALGITFFCLAFGEMPFEFHDVEGDVIPKN